MFYLHIEILHHWYLGLTTALYKRFLIFIDIPSPYIRVNSAWPPRNHRVITTLPAITSATHSSGEPKIRDEEIQRVGRAIFIKSTMLLFTNHINNFNSDCQKKFAIYNPFVLLVMINWWWTILFLQPIFILIHML